MSDERVLDVFSILTSITLPGDELDTEPTPVAKMSPKSSSSMSLLKYLDEKQKVYNRVKHDTVESDFIAEQTQFTDFDIFFALNELSITFDRDTQDGSCETFATPQGEYSSDRESIPTVALCEADDNLNTATDATNSRTLSCKVKQVELNLVQKTYEMKVDIRLGAVSVNQYRKENDEEKVLDVISTPKYDSSSDYLFMLNYLSVRRFLF